LDIGGGRLSPGRTITAMNSSPALAARIASLGRARRLLDFLSRFDLFYRARNIPSDLNPKHIVIPLLWGLGDGVLALPLIQALKARWPDAQIDILAKPFLGDILMPEGVNLWPVHAPWTAAQDKYLFWRAPWRKIFATIGRLRSTPIDLWINLRCDPREMLFARACRPGHILGFAAAGGANWLSADMGLSAEIFLGQYGGSIAARAAEILTGQPVQPSPQFRADTDRCARGLKAVPVRPPLAIVAFGASNPTRYWDPRKVQQVIDGLVARDLNVAVICPPGPMTEMRQGPALEFGPRATAWSGHLKALVDLISIADIFVGTDSGPMHLASALNIPTVAAFGPGSLEMFGPIGARTSLVHIDPMPCRPCFDACIYPSPRCIDEMPASALLDAVDRVLLANPARIT